MLSKGVGTKLAPLQLAVGISGGVEIGAHICQFSYDQILGASVVNLDQKNAYNRIRRAEVYQGLLQHCPQLCRWFRCFYGRSGILVNSEGIRVGASATGVRQGDPLASLAFCCGFHRTLTAVDTEFKTFCGDDFVSFSFAFADDTILVGPHDKLHEFIPTAVDIFGMNGFQVEVR